MLNLDFNKRWSALECKEFIYSKLKQEKLELISKCG